MPTPPNRVVVPGQPLGLLSDHIPGTGVYTRADGQVCASIVGLVQLSAIKGKQQSQTEQPQPDEKQLPILSVKRSTSLSGLPLDGSETSVVTPHLPEVGSSVFARITRLNPRQATASIFAIDDLVLADEFMGIIRAQDVRATEKDKIRIAKSFRPGDIVRAQVISLGDREGYYLSTAGNWLGVVVARSGELEIFLSCV